MPEFNVVCEGPLAQDTIDELHAQGIYLSEGGQAEEESIDELHRHQLLVSAEKEDEAILVAEDAVEAAGGEGRFELQGPAS